MNSISFFRALLMKELDEKELSDKQKKIAKLDPPADELDAGDFKKLRSMKEEEQGELKLGVRYDLDGDSGFIATDGSSDPKDWKFLAGKGKYPYLSVKKKLVPSAKQPGKYDGAFDLGMGKGHHIDETEDHEVSMAHNSLESIIKSAMELKMKLGDNEKDIPAWIQDHITNAENYINQASKNYHEYSDGEHDFDELPDGTEELPAGDKEDAEMSLQSLMETIKGKKKRK